MLSHIGAALLIHEHRSNRLHLGQRCNVPELMLADVERLRVDLAEVRLDVLLVMNLRTLAVLVPGVPERTQLE